MNTAKAVIETCENSSIHLRVLEFGDLAYQCPKGAMTIEIRNAIKNHKSELIQLLRRTGRKTNVYKVRLTDGSMTAISADSNEAFTKAMQGKFGSRLLAIEEQFYEPRQTPT
jgi:hypothetical protein